MFTLLSDVEIIKIVKPFVHYGLHFGFTGIVAWFFFKENWKKVWSIFLLTMLVDLDHLLANPIFDPERCSVGFHPLHSYWAIGIYTLFLFFPKTRILAIGLLLHMATDYLDCFIH